MDLYISKPNIVQFTHVVCTYIAIKFCQFLHDVTFAVLNVFKIVRGTFYAVLEMATHNLSLLYAVLSIIFAP